MKYILVLMVAMLSFFLLSPSLIAKDGVADHDIAIESVMSDECAVLQNCMVKENTVKTLVNIYEVIPIEQTEIILSLYEQPYKHIDICKKYKTFKSKILPINKSTNLKSHGPSLKKGNKVIHKKCKEV